MVQERICEIISGFMTQQGMKQDIVTGVDLFRTDTSTQKAPTNYEPSIIILAQGQKRVYIGDDSISYNPMHYLVLSAPMSLECDTFATDGKPILGIRIRVDAAMVSDMAMSMDTMEPTKKIPPLAIYSDQMEESMSDAVLRLLESLQSSLEAQFLSPLYVREILFRVLCNDNGAALRMLAYRNQGYFRIIRMIEKIHHAYDQKYDVETLAKEADMSVSAFHTAFKAITNSSPLQYIKKEKLHKARELIMQEGYTASLAAYQVGYESPSQFSREYKRMFGVTPASETALETGRNVI